MTFVIFSLAPLMIRTLLLIPTGLINPSHFMKSSARYIHQNFVFMAFLFQYSHLILFFNDTDKSNNSLGLLQLCLPLAWQQNKASVKHFASAIQILTAAFTEDKIINRGCLRTCPPSPTSSD